MLLMATFLFNCIAISSWRSVAVGYTIFLSHGKGLSYGGISMKLDVKATGQRIKKFEQNKISHRKNLQKWQISLRIMCTKSNPG